MTWEIVVGIIALVGFVTSIGTLLFKLSAILTRLDVTVKDMQAANAKDREIKESEHVRMFKQLEAHEKGINDHETRISVLENRGGNNG